jgi:Flp pilus assembly pilin Flp
MSARGLETEYMVINPATAWPVQPWAAVVRTAEAAAEPGSGFVPVAEPAADATVRKSRDRGASAVEWVVITAIVVAIVTGVGVLIANAVKSKATDACKQIANTDTNNTIAGSTGGSSANCG